MPATGYTGSICPTSIDRSTACSHAVDHQLLVGDQPLQAGVFGLELLEAHDYEGPARIAPEEVIETELIKAF